MHLRAEGVATTHTSQPAAGASSTNGARSPAGRLRRRRRTTLAKADLGQPFRSLATPLPRSGLTGHAALAWRRAAPA
jgi:hypothetical protein